MTPYTLIIILTAIASWDGVSAHHVPGLTREDCLAAAASLKAQAEQLGNIRVLTYCAPSSEAPAIGTDLPHSTAPKASSGPQLTPTK